MKWLTEFAAVHGERLFFMAVVTIFGIAFMSMSDMVGEGKTLLIAVATLALNKARTKTPNESEDKQ